MSTKRFTGSDRKSAVRRIWCTEILKSVYAHLGRKYFYLGFPGPEILDILEWREMLGRICAFERPAIGSDDENKWLDELEYNLGRLGINFGTYFGLIEQVMMWKKDLNGRQFEQDELVTLYQLDFCQAVSSWTQPAQMNYRYEAIRCLLRHQGQQVPSEKARPFVMFLTFRDEIHAACLEGFKKSLSDRQEQDLIKSIFDIDPVEGRTVLIRHPSLKAFVFVTLKKYFDGENIRSFFMPPVHYVGSSKSSPMVLFAILGTYDGLHQSTPLSLQTTTDYMTEQCFELSEDATLVPVKKCDIESHSVTTPDATLTEKLGIFVADPVWRTITSGLEALTPARA